MAGSKSRNAMVAAVAVIIVSIVGYWSFGEYRKREQHSTVASLVADASTRMREALSAEAGGASADPIERARRLDEQANEIDKRLEALHRVGAAPNRALYDAGELYLITARELLRRKAASFRQDVAVAQSRKNLHALMRDAGRRSRTWFGQTMRAKEEFEKDVFSYRLSVDAMGNLLESLPNTRAQLKGYVEPAQLLDEELRAKAYEQARAASKSAADEVEQARRFVALQ